MKDLVVFIFLTCRAVTGVAGDLGQAVARGILESGGDVVGVDIGNDSPKSWGKSSSIQF